MKISAIIFDLGGVFIDIDYQKTSMAFKSFGVTNFDDYYQQSFTNPLFAALERGQVDENTFFEALRLLANLPLTDEQIIEAWNAMLGSYRPSSLNFLLELKKKLPIFLLSNTNIIHYKAIMGSYTNNFGMDELDSYFHKTYFSHLIHEKKPSAGAYEIILKENNLIAATTLFIDDTLKNIDAAKAVGMQTLFLPSNVMVEDALKNSDFEF